MKVKNTGAESTLKLESLVFTNISFSQPNPSVDVELKLNINRTITPLSNDKHRVMLVMILSDEKKQVEIKLEAVAIFVLEHIDNMPDEDYSDIINKNTVSIMFPYLRSQLTLLTSQPGCVPIIMPPMNINSLLEDETINN